MNGIPRWQSIASHVLAGLTAFAMLGAGGSKLAGAEMHVESFARWGFPGGFLYVTGAVEVIGALLLLLPRTRFWGAALLVPTMLGAVGTHLLHGEAAMIGPAAVLGVLSALAAWPHRPVGQVAARPQHA